MSYEPDKYHQTDPPCELKSAVMGRQNSRKKNEAKEETKPESGSLSGAAPCSAGFSAGRIVSHRLNSLKGIITSKGTLRNGGQCWNVRFERDNYFEELEVWEHELFLSNVRMSCRPKQQPSK